MAFNPLLKTGLSLLEKDTEKNFNKVMKIAATLSTDSFSKKSLKLIEETYKTNPQFKASVNDFFKTTDSEIINHIVIDIINKKTSDKNFASEKTISKVSLVIDADGLKNMQNLSGVISKAENLNVFAVLIINLKENSIDLLKNIYNQFPEIIFIPEDTGILLKEDSCAGLKRSRNVIPVVKNESNVNYRCYKKNGIPVIKSDTIKSLIKTYGNNIKDAAEAETYVCVLDGTGNPAFNTASLKDILKNL